MAPRRLLSRGSWPEAQRLATVLRRESVGGLLLIGAAVIALLWANSPWSAGYLSLRDVHVGPASWGLDLSLAHWAADGLLAIFFFVVGLELKREFVIGDLRDPKRAALPVVAAAAGVAVPAVFYLVVNLGNDRASVGWAIPTATDIAFALAVLAVLGSHLPVALRTFLLTLAVVDDLIAITIIAIFYTADLAILPLALALIPLGLFALIVQRGHGWLRSWPVLVPLAVLTWALVHASGVHATVAGVLLAFTVPVRPRPGEKAGHGLAERWEHAIRPFSAGVAVPIFAFFSAGVVIGGLSGLRSAYTDTITVGIMIGLVLGKIVGIMGATWLMSKFTKADLDDSLAWWDVLGLSALAGIGFTVSLLVGELAFRGDTLSDDHVKIGVLTASLLAALLAAVILRSRNKVYRRIEEEETIDADHDGIPDVYQRDEN